MACTTTSGGYFLAGDFDADGTLVLIIADTGTLTFPIEVECGFSEIAPVAASDFTVVVKEVVQDLWPGYPPGIGDPSVLTVAVDVD